jgi:hypothetical protein
MEQAMKFIIQLSADDTPSKAAQRTLNEIANWLADQSLRYGAKADTSKGTPRHYYVGAEKEFHAAAQFVRSIGVK